MAAARIAAVLFVTTLQLVTGAQQLSKSQLTIQITDVTGARIPRAQVRIAAGATTSEISWSADEFGMASLNLEPGSYQATVSSPGFCPEKKAFEVVRQLNLSINVQLSIGGCPSKCTPICVVVYPGPTGGPAFDHPEIHLETVAKADTISLRPLRNFGPLPAHGLKRR